MFLHGDQAAVQGLKSSDLFDLASCLHGKGLIVRVIFSLSRRTRDTWVCSSNTLSVAATAAGRLGQPHTRLLDGISQVCEVYSFIDRVL